MRKRLSHVVECIFLFALAGCHHTQKGEGDLLLTRHIDAAGPTIQTGELAELRAIEKTAEGEVILSATGDDRTVLLIRQPAVFKGDLFTALGELSEGDSATININLDSMVNKLEYAQPANSKEKYIRYELAVKRVLHRGSMSDSQYQQAMNAFVQVSMGRLQQAEAGRIENFIKGSKLQTIKQPSGLQYSITAARHGAGARAGDTIEANYTAHFLNGKVIDATPAQPRRFICGNHTVLPGLNEAFGLLPPGVKATVVLPSALAFGATGYQNIQPYTPLVYEINMVRIGRFTGKAPDEKGAGIPGFAATQLNNNHIIQKDDVVNGRCAFVLFTTGCDHCQQLITALNKRHTNFPDIHWYFISADSATAIQQCMQQYGRGLLAKSNVTVLHDEDHLTAAAFRLMAYPALYVYNAKHRLMQQATGDKAIDIVSGLQ